MARALGIERKVVIEGVRQADDVIVVACRLRKNAAPQCGICGRRSARV